VMLTPKSCVSEFSLYGVDVKLFKNEQRIKPKYTVFYRGPFIWILEGEVA
jgi:hypothetical protein